LDITSFILTGVFPVSYVQQQLLLNTCKQHAKYMNTGVQ